MNNEFDSDVIIIGAGGGGAVVAKELSERGIKVLVLEAGPWYGNAKWPNPNTEPGEKSSSEYRDLNIDLLKRSFTDLEDDMNNLLTGKLRWGPADRNRPPWQRIGGLTWQNAGVGGSTLHYFANSPRAFPLAVDNVWPIPYSELIPYYERVELTLPVRPAPVTAKEELFYYGAKKAGWQYNGDKDYTSPGYRPQPNAILGVNPSLKDPNFDINNNRSIGCTLRGHCINGCHTGPTIEGVAKRSTLVSYIPRALDSGNVVVRPNTFAVKIITENIDSARVRALGVLARDTWTGEMNEYRAKVIVMAAGGVESPRLWLNSELPHNDWVGRGMVNHWFDNITGIFEEKAIMDAIGESDIKPFVGQNAAARFDYPGLGVIMPVGMSPGLYSSTMYGSSSKGYNYLNTPELGTPWDMEGSVVGEQLKEFMKDYRRTLSVTIFTDDQVDQRNGVTLDTNVKDEHGYIPVLHYQASAADAEKRDKLSVIAANILRSAGAKIILRSNWSPDFFIHIMSTMRMGYVTDTDCEAYQVKGLFIADNSILFNGLGGPNPTLTTQALAVRTSEKIINRYFINQI